MARDLQLYTLCRVCVESCFDSLTGNEPSHEVMVLFSLHKLILQTRMRSHPMGLDAWSLVGPFDYFHTLCVRMRDWADVQARLIYMVLYDKYHNRISWTRNSSNLIHNLYSKLLWLPLQIQLLRKSKIFVVSYSNKSVFSKLPFIFP